MSGAVGRSSRDPWTYRCPKGHAAVETRQTGVFLCESCEAYYEGTPIDARTVDGFPLDDGRVDELFVRPRGGSPDGAAACSHGGREGTQWRTSPAAVFPAGHTSPCSKCFPDVDDEGFAPAEHVDHVARLSSAQNWQHGGKTVHRVKGNGAGS